MTREKILIVDDETTIQFVLATLMTELGHDVIHVGSAEEAEAEFEQGPFALAMLDIVLPGMSGLGLLGRIKEVSPDTEVMMMTSHASIDTAIEALRKGAYDYIHKPFELDDVTAAVNRALDSRRLTLQNRVLLEQQARHNEELMQVVGRLRSLNAAGSGMSGIATLPELLDFFVGLVADELDAERVSLMLRSEDGKELRVAASRGLPEGANISVQVGDGEAILVGREPSAHAADSRKTDSFDSVPTVMSVPIRTPESILGVIIVTDRRNKRPFDDEDKAYLNALAGQAGVAIERARQSEHLRRAYETLRTTQDQVVASSRLKALGEMAAGVAHDFNDVLNGVLGRSQLIQVGLRGSPPQIDRALGYADVIEKLSLQGAETVKRIQEFALVRKDRPTQILDLNHAVRLAVDLTRSKWSEESRSHGIEIEMQLKLEETPPIIGTPEEVGQIISNLIFNAVDAMPKGGRVSIRTTRRNDSVCLMVSDTGCGMNEETRARLFEPFFTTKANGQGLGMSVVYGIVQRMAGEITVETAEQKGSTLTITFPAQADARAPAEAVAGSPKSVGRARIMLVDDDPQNLDLCQDFLIHAGHEVVTASSGSEALIELREKPAHLVVTDLSMPEMSGLELARTIRSSMPQVRVVILSGWAVQQDDQSLRESGVMRVLSKPIGFLQLVEAVNTALAA